MTEKNTTKVVPSKILEIKASCEQLINETQNEIRVFQIEQEAFREHIVDVAEENSRLKKQLELIQSSNSLFDNTRNDITSKECSNDIIRMLQQEIVSFKEENEELKKIHDYLRTTIENHEKEIQSYREYVFGNDLTKDPDEKQTKKLEDALVEKEAELNEKSLYIETLESQKQVLLDEIKTMQAELNGKVAKMTANQKDAVNKAHDIISDASKEKLALKSSLEQASLVIAEHMEKERTALQKMGEALEIAEIAYYEKEEVLRNKAILEKERDFLAATIGQVMEEASQKVERQMKKMNKKLREYQKKLAMLRIENEDNITNQKKAYANVETILNTTQEENRKLNLEIAKLKKDREIMQRALDKIGIKMQPNGTFSFEDNDDKLVIEQLRTEIKQINMKCKIAVDDITQEFQKTVTRLSSENAELKAELKILRG